MGAALAVGLAIIFASASLIASDLAPHFGDLAEARPSDSGPSVPDEPTFAELSCPSSTRHLDLAIPSEMPTVNSLVNLAMDRRDSYARVDTVVFHIDGGLQTVASGSSLQQDERSAWGSITINVLRPAQTHGFFAVRTTMSDGWCGLALSYVPWAVA